MQDKSHLNLLMRLTDDYFFVTDHLPNAKTLIHNVKSYYNHLIILLIMYLFFLVI